MRNILNWIKTQMLKPTATKTPKKLAFQHIKMEFEKTNFQSEIEASKQASNTNKLEAI